MKLPWPLRKRGKEGSGSDQSQIWEHEMYVEELYAVIHQNPYQNKTKVEGKIREKNWCGGCGNDGSLIVIYECTIEITNLGLFWLSEVRKYFNVIYEWPPSKRKLQKKPFTNVPFKLHQQTRFLRLSSLPFPWVRTRHLMRALCNALKRRKTIRTRVLNVETIYGWGSSLFSFSFFTAPSYIKWNSGRET